MTMKGDTGVVLMGFRSYCTGIGSGSHGIGTVDSTKGRAASISGRRRGLNPVGKVSRIFNAASSVVERALCAIFVKEVFFFFFVCISVRILRSIPRAICWNFFSASDLAVQSTSEGKKVKVGWRSKAISLSCIIGLWETVRQSFFRLLS